MRSRATALDAADTRSLVVERATGGTRLLAAALHLVRPTLDRGSRSRRERRQQPRHRGLTQPRRCCFPACCSGRARMPGGGVASRLAIATQEKEGPVLTMRPETRRRLETSTGILVQEFAALPRAEVVALVDAWTAALLEAA